MTARIGVVLVHDATPADLTVTAEPAAIRIGGVNIGCPDLDTVEQIGAEIVRLARRKKGERAQDAARWSQPPRDYAEAVEQWWDAYADDVVELRAIAEMETER